jgi:hypothetical protein
LHFCFFEIDRKSKKRYFDYTKTQFLSNLSQMSAEVSIEDDSVFDFFKLSLTQLVVLGVMVFGVCGINIFVASNIYSNLQSERKSEAMNGIAVLKISTVLQLIMMVFFSFFFWHSQDKSRFVLKIYNVCFCVVYSVMIGICLNKIYTVRRDTFTEDEMSPIFYMLIVISILFGLSFVGNFGVIGITVYLESTKDTLSSVNNLVVSTTNLTNKLVTLPDFAAQTTAASTKALLDALTKYREDNLELMKKEFAEMAKLAGKSVVEGLGAGVPGAVGNAITQIPNAAMNVLSSTTNAIANAPSAIADRVVHIIQGASPPPQSDPSAPPAPNNPPVPPNNPPVPPNNPPAATTV